MATNLIFIYAIHTVYDFFPDSNEFLRTFIFAFFHKLQGFEAELCHSLKLINFHTPAYFFQIWSSWLVKIKIPLRLHFFSLLKPK